MLFAVFTSGYILGVWTACRVLGQDQPAYENGVPTGFSFAALEAVRQSSRTTAGRP
ncbi:MAG TPA: hypothetical protein VG426_09275 [Candidatus Dormibacteraeota bacterium]|nr:hypothetical protein [Candidatus Dormibacteraeota bacterium]